jgi:NADH-quinone oxidoreductase subunit F
VPFFRSEYVAHWENGGCPFDPAASTLFAPAGAST